MKKSLHLLLLMFVSLGISAQTAIPNGNFESWTITPYENPENYFTNNLDNLFDGLSAGTTKTTDAYHGSYALKLTTLSNESLSMTGNYNPNSPPPWNGGMPISGTPTGLRGYYKYDIQEGDSAIILVNFSTAGVNIGVYMVKIFGSQPDYTLFNIPFDPPLPMAPDSVILFFISSDAFYEVPVEGSTISIDSISFTGIATQPSLLNGDFENWELFETKSPDFWYQDGNLENRVEQTTDAAVGMSAAKLTSYLDNWDEGPRNVPQRLSTQYWDNDCECMAGGYPYSLQVDTISFWYKYTPTDNDTASFRAVFMKEGMFVGDIYENLFASSNYQYFEIPFNLPMAPDTVRIEIMSGSWYNTLLSSVGTTLFIDEVQFKSQPLTTGISSNVFKQGISVYPNPGNGIFNILSVSEFNQVEVRNITGQIVFSGNYNAGGVKTINLENQPKGVYLYKILKNNNILKTGKLVLE